jgi:MOSC domain-containing protein YiiM
LSRIDIGPALAFSASMLLSGIQVGTPRTHLDEDGRQWTTGYGKTAVHGPVLVGRENLAGDRQADVRQHGGPDMAVLAYAEAHYARWRLELRWPDVPYGAFGENFTVAGVTEDDACLGDVWRVGTALLQISEPRKPCRNIPRFWHRPDLLRLVERTGRYGFYLRVLEEGLVEAGQPIDVVERPNPDWTIRRATVARSGAAGARAEARALLDVAELGADWRAHIERALGRG